MSADLGLPDPAMHRVKQRDRRVVKLENFTDQDMALLAAVEVPAEHAHLDEELKGWQESVGRSYQ